MATTHPVEGPALPHTQSETSPEILTPSSSTSASPKEPELVEAHVEDLPTESHQLAHATEGENIDEVGPGLAQLNHGQTEVKDLGWNEDLSEITQPLVGGLSNEELWTLLRRFNKQMYHVKSLKEPPIGGLDLNIADEEEFSPDKLRANVERLYMTVIVGLVGFYQHIVRLRSWRERNRTLAFAGVYFLAWAVDMLMPTILTFLIVLIVYRPARPYCFPPAPLALIDTKTGGVKKPTAGVLGSDNSLTGAPEKHEGEAVEQEASNFFNSFTSIAISSAAGKHPEGDPPHDNDSRGLIAPDPSKLGHGLSDAKDKSTGGEVSAVHDKTKEPMSQAMWSKTRPVMHAIADIADTWERFGNVLHATSPFPHKRPRLKLAGCLVPVLLASIFTTSYMFTKINGLIIGFAFFSDPLIWRGLEILNRKVPNWQKYLELRNSILKGIPTNAQLTITLLRIGEANKAPLPPPPYSGPPPPMEAHENAGKDLEHLDGKQGVSEAELSQAINPDAETLAKDASAGQKTKHKGRHFIAAIKSATKGGVESLLGADRLKAAAGREHAQNRLGVLKKGNSEEAGPVEFPSRFRGKKGHAYITTSATSPAVSWTSSKENENPVWSIAIADIQEIKKVGGLGWKSKLIVGWATSREIADGIIIVDKLGNQKQLTAIALREELFNRLIAMGSQMWESW